MEIIKRIIDRWDAIKAIIKCDEYFLGVAKQKDNNSRVICYDYINNTDRDMFYNFVHDYIEDKFMSIK